MNEQKPLENITIEEFNLYRNVVQKTEDIHMRMTRRLVGGYNIIGSFFSLMIGYVGVQESLYSLQTNPQKGDYFLFDISSLAILFGAGTALYFSRTVGKMDSQIKTLETELDEIKKDPTYQKLENIEYPQTTGMNHNEENKK